MRAGPDLLYSLLAEHPREREVFETVVNGNTRLSGPWWIKHCPVTITQYFDTAREYYSRIESSKLRLTCDLLFLPAVLGADYDKGR